MKLILVTGIEQTDKNRLLGMSISTMNNGTWYKDFFNINLNAMRSVSNSFFAGDIKESYLSIYDDLEKVLTTSKRNAFNIVLDAPLTINTQYGYVPILTERFFSIMKPDSILLLENRLEDFKDSQRELLLVKEQQEINRSYCIKFSSEFSLPLKIIKVNKSELKQTVREIQEYLLSVSKQRPKAAPV